MSVSRSTSYAGSDFPLSMVLWEISGKSLEELRHCVSSESNKLACLHASITRLRMSESCEGLPMCALIATWMASISDSISKSR